MMCPSVQALTATVIGAFGAAAATVAMTALKSQLTQAEGQVTSLASEEAAKQSTLSEATVAAKTAKAAWKTAKHQVSPPRQNYRPL